MMEILQEGGKFLRSIPFWDGTCSKVRGGGGSPRTAAMVSTPRAPAAWRCST